MATIFFVSDHYAGGVNGFMCSVPYLYQINFSAGGLPKLPMPEAWLSVKGVEGDRQRNQTLMRDPSGPHVCFRSRLLRPYNRRGIQARREPPEKICPWLV